MLGELIEEIGRHDGVIAEFLLLKHAEVGTNRKLFQKDRPVDVALLFLDPNELLTGLDVGTLLL